jgi:hypothetical protein
MFHTSVKLTEVEGWYDGVMEGPLEPTELYPPSPVVELNEGNDNEDEEKLVRGEVRPPGFGFEPKGFVLNTFKLGEEYALNEGASGCDKTV